MKNINFLISLCFLLAFVLVGCDKDNDCIVADGNMKSKVIDLNRFQGINFSLPGKVEIIKSNTSKIEIQASESIIDIISTEINSNILNINTGRRCISGNTSDMVFKVYTPSLSSIKLSGVGDIYSNEVFPQSDWTVQVQGSGNIYALVDANNLNGIVTGNGNITLRGTANQFKANISGSGNIKAFDLSARELDATISGSGNVESTVSETIKALISGSGNVIYKGNASVTQSNITGSGKIIKM